MDRTAPAPVFALLLSLLVAGPWAGPAAAQDDPFFSRPGEVEDDPGPGFRRPGQEISEEEETGRGPRRPDRGPLPPPLPKINYQTVPIPDRWRLVEAVGVNERLWDPYNQNTLKADRPILGSQEWFFNLLTVSDTVIEPRRIPTPTGQPVSDTPGTLDVFADGDQLFVSQNFIVSTAIIKGDTVFRPPDYEFRFTGVGNITYVDVDDVGVLKSRTTQGLERTSGWFGVQDFFVDKHLRNKSDRYDFDSLRIGIQPFTSDFRGFLFQDNQPGVRLFGTFENNRIQYNVAFFRRLEKEINSGLNDFEEPRDDDVYALNVYYQDFPVLGFTTQASVTYNMNRENGGREFDRNGFLQRPALIGDAQDHKYDVVYLGLAGDGHFDRLNLTYQLYYAVGHDSNNPLAKRSQTISSFFAAVEASMDFDWWRAKGFLLYAMGDGDIDNQYASGFDAIFENPQFAGADTSFWQRQAIPLIFGGGVQLVGRNALLPNLRTSKEQGQSNFVNPGLQMYGVGTDFDILPELRFSTNFSYLRFDHTDSLRLARNQGPINQEIGWDLSGAITYRPLFTQNVVFRLSGATLVPRRGFKQLFGDEGTVPYWSVLANLILTF